MRGTDADAEQRLADLDRELLASRGRAVQLERENRRLRAENEDLRAKLDAVYASETFRLGEAILKVPRRIKLLLRRSGRRAATTTTVPSVRPPADASFAVRYDVTEDADQRVRYERFAARRGYAADVRHRLAIAVYTLDLDEGRGDLYTAVGLARRLEDLGYGVVLLPPDRWYEPPEGTDTVLAMVAEPRLTYEPAALAAECRVVAWVRNNTDRWTDLAGLPLFDGVLASSPRSLDAIRRRYHGPSGLLPIGVDLDLFHPPEPTSNRRGALATINQWGSENPRRVYRELAEAGVDFPLAIHGVQRGLDAHLEPLARGPVSYFAVPSLYRQAAVVLDDQQDVNQRFGNVNSRIYEALACGALPITGASRGLAEAGLEDVPTFTDGPDLSATVKRWLGDDGRIELVTRLRRTVVDRHGYAARAADLDRFLRGLETEPAGSASPKPVLVGFQPDYRVTNPYQRMLYAKLRAPEYAVVPVEGPSPLRGVPGRRAPRRLLHLNWTATILGPARHERDADRRADRFLADLDGLAQAGGQLVWTVHNALPHDCRFPDVERRLRQAIADRADAVHVMCADTPRALAPLYRLPEDRVRVIGHGSYVDVYPNLVTAEDARAELGVPGEATTYLFLGQIRPYKGLERLLDAFEALASTDRQVHLLVAGKPVNHPEAAELERRCRSHARITPVFRELEDVELQLFLNAADVVVLPHTRALNSGGVLLAYAFGRPVIAPRIGCLAEQVDPETGLLFDHETGDLSEVLAAGRALRDPTYRRAAYERARAYTYLDMAQDFRRLVEELTGSAG